MLIIALTPLYPIALVWSIIDVIRLNKQEIQPRFAKKEAIWAIVILLVVVPVLAILAFSGMLSVGQWFSDKYLKSNATIEEGNNIASAIHRHYKNSGKYPTDIDTLIGSIPIRSGWKTDRWNEPYVYEVLNDGENFKLISKGQDRNFGTEDDIVFQ